MSTRLRTVLELEGSFYHGRKLKQLLKDYFNLTRNTLSVPEIRNLVGQFPARYKAGLYVYREPRRVRFNRSRYKKLAAKFGFARIVKKKKSGYDLPDWLTGAVPRLTIRRPEPAPTPTMRQWDLGPGGTMTFTTMADAQVFAVAQAAQTPQLHDDLTTAFEGFRGIEENATTERTDTVPRPRQSPPRG